MHIMHTCTGVPGPKEARISVELQLQEVANHLMLVQRLNSDLLQDHQVPLTTKPSRQALYLAYGDCLTGTWGSEIGLG